MAFTSTTLIKDLLDLQQVRSALPPGQGIEQYLSELQDKFDASSGHTHAGTTEDGPQLDWDTCWSDAVHTHASNAEGGQLDWDNIWSDAVHDHSTNAEGGNIPNTSLSAPNSYFTVSFHCSRQLTASVTGLFGFQMPFAATAVEVSAYARASGGTSPTLTIDVLEAGTSILTSPITVTAGANAVATPSDTAIADNAAITVDAAIGGTTPTWDDISVVITFKVAHTS